MRANYAPRHRSNLIPEVTSKCLLPECRVLRTFAKNPESYAPAIPRPSKYGLNFERALLFRLFRMAAIGCEVSS
jgi:hypothetical protein